MFGTCTLRAHCWLPLGCVLLAALLPSTCSAAGSSTGLECVSPCRDRQSRGTPCLQSLNALSEFLSEEKNKVNHNLVLQWLRSRSWGRDKLHLVFNIFDIANW